VISGADSPFSTRTVNATQIALGRIGLLQSFNVSLSTGARYIITFRFRVLPGAPTGASQITFGDEPAASSMTNELAESLDATFTGGNVTITGAVPGSLQFSSAMATVAERWNGRFDGHPHGRKFRSSFSSVRNGKSIGNRRRILHCRGSITSLPQAL